ncbi:hypothetical protein PGTUg99_004930 [Puccinia graminis f. sp. tritici]|uniref:Uncharacterized protein n=1 Tax=Puccinia graminis f. sp. tritici TaxID=56615 RepID=A0A5B0P9Y4_PUCGR|nr:hypothetical protein PGTUg99_004930 [Puccinia graminis f. sp. tritici]
MSLDDMCRAQLLKHNLSTCLMPLTCSPILTATTSYHTPLHVVPKKGISSTSSTSLVYPSPCRLIPSELWCKPLHTYILSVLNTPTIITLHLHYLASVLSFYLYLTIPDLSLIFSFIL